MYVLEGQGWLSLPLSTPPEPCLAESLRADAFHHINPEGLIRTEEILMSSDSLVPPQTEFFSTSCKEDTPRCFSPVSRYCRYCTWVNTAEHFQPKAAQISCKSSSSHSSLLLPTSQPRSAVRITCGLRLCLVGPADEAILGPAHCPHYASLGLTYSLPLVISGFITKQLLKK